MTVCLSACCVPIVCKRCRISSSRTSVLFCCDLLWRVRRPLTVLRLPFSFGAAGTSSPKRGMLPGGGALGLRREYREEVEASGIKAAETDMNGSGAGDSGVTAANDDVVAATGNGVVTADVDDDIVVDTKNRRLFNFSFLFLSSFFSFLCCVCFVSSPM